LVHRVQAKDHCAQSFRDLYKGSKPGSGPEQPVDTRIPLEDLSYLPPIPVPWPRPSSTKDWPSQRQRRYRGPVHSALPARAPGGTGAARQTPVDHDAALRAVADPATGQILESKSMTNEATALKFPDL
jgi:hypothetical protein